MGGLSEYGNKCDEDIQQIRLHASNSWITHCCLSISLLKRARAMVISLTATVVMQRVIHDIYHQMSLRVFEMGEWIPHKGSVIAQPFSVQRDSGAVSS